MLQVDYLTPNRWFYGFFFFQFEPQSSSGEFDGLVKE